MTAEQEACDCRLNAEAAADALYWRMLADAQCSHALDLVPTAAEQIAAEPMDCE